MFLYRIPYQKIRIPRTFCPHGGQMRHYGSKTTSNGIFGHMMNQSDWSFEKASHDIKNIGDDLKNKTTDMALENAIKVLQVTENKIKQMKMDTLEINVSLSLGPVGITLSKKINADE